MGLISVESERLDVFGFDTEVIFDKVEGALLFSLVFVLNNVIKFSSMRPSKISVTGT